MAKKLKICLAASAGGHLTQLLKLSQSWVGHDTFFVTTVEAVRKKLGGSGRVYVVGECNRQHPLLVLRVFIKCMKIVLKERPDVVISTGAAAGCITCLMSRVLGAKIVWIDSITNVERVSLSGRIVGRFAHLFLVQWPQLAEKYRRAEYLGQII